MLPGLEYDYLTASRDDESVEHEVDFYLSDHGSFLGLLVSSVTNVHRPARMAGSKTGLRLFSSSVHQAGFHLSRSQMRFAAAGVSWRKGVTSLAPISDRSCGTA